MDTNFNTNIGMLWYDDDDKSMIEKIKDAAEFYQNKYGAKPNRAFVRDVEFDPEMTIDGIEIRPSVLVARNHVWIGVRE